MTSFNLRLTAWDNLDQVWWTVKVWDFDADEENGESALYTLAGSLDGEGLDLAPRWLRFVLENVREAL